MRNYKTAIQQARNFLKDGDQEDASEVVKQLSSVLEEIDRIKKNFRYVSSDLAEEFERIYNGYLSEAKQPSLNQLLSYVRISDAKQRMEARMDYRLRCLIDDGEIFELY